MSKPIKVDEIPKEESVPVKPEEEAVEVTPSEEPTSDEEVAVTEEPTPIEEKAVEESEPEETSEKASEEETEEPTIDVEPPFKVMPGKKKPKGPTVKDRIPQFRDKALKLYKRMKPGERLTEKEFAKRLKLKDPKDIQAAGIAWHHLFDEGLVAVPQFYKPLVRTNR